MLALWARYQLLGDGALTNSTQRVTAGLLADPGLPVTSRSASYASRSKLSLTERHHWLPGRADSGGASNRLRPALIAGAGWDFAVDGQSWLQHGPLARLGIALGRVELAAELETGLRVERSDGQARFSLQRRAAVLDVDLSVLERARFAFALGAQIGAASFARRTLSVGSGLKATSPDAIQPTIRMMIAPITRRP